MNLEALWKSNLHWKDALANVRFVRNFIRKCSKKNSNQSAIYISYCDGLLLEYANGCRDKTLFENTLNANCLEIIGKDD